MNPIASAAAAGAASAAAGTAASAVTNAVVGEFVWTPGLVEARLRELHTAIELVHREIYEQRATLGDAFVRSWEVWLRGWFEFWREYGSPAPWTARIWGGGIADQAERWHQGLERWRAMVRERGGQLRSPEPTAVQRTTVSSVLGADPSSVAREVAPIAVAVAATMAIGGAIYFFGGRR